MQFHLRIAILSLAILLCGPSNYLFAQKDSLPKTPDKYLKRKVLIIGIDGLRKDCIAPAKTPRLDEIRHAGAWSYNVDRGPYTVSGPGWSNMLTGVWHDKHGVVNNSFKGKNFKQFPHIFTRIRSRRPGLRLASLVHWWPINMRIVSDADVRRKFLKDENVVKATLRTMRHNCPSVIFVHLDDVDHAGHAHGYHPDTIPYLREIEDTDRLVGYLMDAVISREYNFDEEWLVIVSTDHGGTSMGTHGGQDDNPDVRKVFLYIRGKHAQQGEIEPAPEIVDIPATVLKYLGIKPSVRWELDGEPVGLKPEKSQDDE